MFRPELPALVQEPRPLLYEVTEVSPCELADLSPALAQYLAELRLTVSEI